MAEPGHAPECPDTGAPGSWLDEALEASMCKWELSMWFIYGSYFHANFML